MSLDVWRQGSNGLRPTTPVLNLSVMCNHLLPRFGGYPLARITTSDVKAMIADSIATGGSVSAPAVKCSCSAGSWARPSLRGVSAATGPPG